MAKIVTTNKRDNRFKASARAIAEASRLMRVEVGEEMKKLGEQATGSWVNPVPFDVVVTQRSAELTTSSKAFGFVNKGTRVRRALMSPDFVAKSTPGSLASGAGQGGVVFVSRKLNLPGIKARHYDEQIVERVTPLIVGIWRKNIRQVRGF